MHTVLFKKNNYYKELAISLCINLIMYACVFVKHYSTDSYWVMKWGYGTVHFDTGRICTGIVYYFLQKVGINYVKLFKCMVFSLLLSISIFSAMMTNALKKVLNVQDYKELWIIRFAMTLVFANPFVQEWFGFWEASVQWCGTVIFVALALEQIFEGKALKQLILQYVFLTISLFFYQVSLPLYIVLGCTFAYIIERSDIKNAMIKVIEVFVIAALAGGTNFVVLKILQMLGMANVTQRTGNSTLGQIIDNIGDIIGVLPEVFINSLQCFPKYLYCFLMLIFLTLIGKKEIEKKRYLSILFVILWTVVSVIAVFIPHLPVTEVWVAERTVVGVWAIISSLALIYYCVFKSDKEYIRAEGVLLAILMFVCMVSIIKEASSQICCNKQDEEIAYAVQNQIKRYEADTGVEVRKIGVMNDKNPQWHYMSVGYWYNNACDSARLQEWSNVNFINYYNGTDYEKTEVDELIRDKYLDIDYEYFSPTDQLVFLGDTVYIIAF